MEKQFHIVFYLADFQQYTYLLNNDELRSKISSFLLKYVSIEAFYKKMLIAEIEQRGEKVDAQKKRNLNVKISDVKRVLKYFGIRADEDLVERVFGSNDKNYMECSVKKLRDRLVHNVNSSVLRCILERYDAINRDLDAFLALFTQEGKKTKESSLVSV